VVAGGEQSGHRNAQSVAESEKPAGFDMLAAVLREEDRLLTYVAWQTVCENYGKAAEKNECSEAEQGVDDDLPIVFGKADNEQAG